MNRLVNFAGAAALTLGVATPAFANDHNGDELRGQSVDILFADGTRNTVFFGSTGTATITNTTGQASRANWFVDGDKLCLSAGMAKECYNYTDKFVAGQTVSMTSNCNTGARWTARAVNAPRQEVAPELGERG